MTNDFSINSDYLSSLSPARRLIANTLLGHSWFKNTDPVIQRETLSLPEDHDGLLRDLATRPDEIGELDVLKMTKIGYGHFLVILVFEVRSNITNQVFTYEYASWKTGANPGARGIIFLEKAGQITHFLVSKNHRFSSNEAIYESIGGLYLHIFEKQLQNLPKKMENEICFHLGTDQLEFNKVINLGKAHPDYGMTNNISDLFAATIDISELPPIIPKADFRQTRKPVGYEIKVVPINEFTNYIKTIEDNYFLSASARIMASKEISFGL